MRIRERYSNTKFLRANQVELTVEKYKDNLEFYYKGEIRGY